MEEQSIREKRIRRITNLYYSRQDIQKAIFEFCKNREICPRYFEGFGKRPDSLEYPGDIFELVKKGATSFNCSEEIWEEPLKLSTDMDEFQLNKLRTGWDLLLDIDSKYLDYSKICAGLIIRMLRFHGIKHLGVKFSGSKGFHIIIPWKAFPKEVNQIQTKDKFPEWPRIVVKYLMEKTKKQLIEKISDLERPNKYIKDFQASREVMPDLILVSPRHLFRTPYSLHEKTSLASVVVNPEEIQNFDMKDADPMKAEIRNFMPDAEEGEARELLVQALDWHKENNPEEKEKRIKGDFKPIKLSKLSDENFPPCIKKILKGLSDGRKRALFILINLFRSVGMEKDEFEKRIEDWNKKNKPPLKRGYILSQIKWSYRNKIVLPPNFDTDYYKGVGVVPTEEELRYKNPVNYVVKKTFGSMGKDSRIKKKK